MVMIKHVYKNPKAYGQNNELQYDFSMRVLENIEIDKKARVLDIGCGDGKITREIAKIAHEGCVIGTDISYQMIEHAAKTYSEQENLEFRQMDACKNKFTDQFDLITSFNCLHWVKDQEKVLNGIVRAAAKNAKVVLLLGHKKSIYHLVLDRVCESIKWRSYFTDYVNPRSFFECEVYNGILIRSGLEIISISEEVLTYNFDSRKKFMGFLNASMANIKQIPENKKEAFLEDYCDEFINEVAFNGGGHIPVSFWSLVVQAAYNG